jgi:hypothetical protein
VLDMGELGQQQIQAESYHNQEKNVAPHLHYGRASRLGVSCHSLRTGRDFTHSAWQHWFIDASAAPSSRRPESAPI